MTAGQVSGKQRQRDPRMRDRIIAAALGLIAERGLAGLTHRGVAAAAGVSLSSTTYYFATLDDLIHLALQRCLDQQTDYQRDLRERLADAGREELLTALTDMAMDCFGPHRNDVLIQYELCMAALRRPELRTTASLFAERTITTLTQFTDPATATVLYDLTMGLVLRGLAAQHPPDRATVQNELSAAFTPQK
ncbi:TetR family transcriptional regulator [Nocardia sp. NPDC046473]|uniref:TetR/AcrR family transcriptional regulator n=1 Tax=Nocardia sp. NPDC046473 TaxID=3155733 RepID=UPI0033C21703